MADSANAFSVLEDCGESEALPPRDDDAEVGLDDPREQTATGHCVAFLRGTRCPCEHPHTLDVYEKQAWKQEDDVQWCYYDVFYNNCINWTCRCNYRHTSGIVEADQIAEGVVEAIYRERGACKYAMIAYGSKCPRVQEDPVDVPRTPAVPHPVRALAGRLPRAPEGVRSVPRPADRGRV